MEVLSIVDLDKKLRDLRQEHGMTQLQVAQKVGVTAAVISAYENGLRFPSYGILVKLAGLYDVTSDYLLGVSGRKNAESKYVVSLDGLSPSNINLVMQIIDALKQK